jgi:hypothetical protein
MKKPCEQQCVCKVFAVFELDLSAVDLLAGGRRVAFRDDRTTDAANGTANQQRAKQTTATT